MGPAISSLIFTKHLRFNILHILFVLEINMPKPFSNLLAILFILLSFFGQTMAYSANLPTNTASHSQQSSATDYILTDEQAQSEDECCDTQCCEVTCICPANTCVSAYYLPSQVKTTALVVQKSNVINQHVERKVLMPTHVFRPPISIS